MTTDARTQFEAKRAAGTLDDTSCGGSVIEITEAPPGPYCEADFYTAQTNALNDIASLDETCIELSFYKDIYHIVYTDDPLHTAPQKISELENTGFIRVIDPSRTDECAQGSIIQADWFEVNAQLGTTDMLKVKRADADGAIEICTDDETSCYTPAEKCEVHAEGGEFTVDGATGVRIMGTDGQDTIFGSDGDDIIDGLAGLNLINGNEGDDIIIIRSSDNANHVSGGDGQPATTEDEGCDIIIFEGEFATANFARVDELRGCDKLLFRQFGTDGNLTEMEITTAEVQASTAGMGQFDQLTYYIGIADQDAWICNNIPPTPFVCAIIAFPT